MTDPHSLNQKAAVNQLLATHRLRVQHVVYFTSLCGRSHAQAIPSNSSRCSNNALRCLFYLCGFLRSRVSCAWSSSVQSEHLQPAIRAMLTCFQFTNAVDAYQTLVGGRRSEWIHSVHAQYGSVVRIGPNLMSINNPDCLKSVYGGKFPKSEPRYFGKHMDETEHMLIMNTSVFLLCLLIEVLINGCSHEKFRARRNILLPLFQQKNLQSFEPDLQHYTSVFLEQIEKEQKAEGSADVFRWFRLVAFDIICSLAYGVDMRMTAEGKKNKLVEWMEQVYVSLKRSHVFVFQTSCQQVYFTLKDFIGKTIITVAESGVFGKLKDIASAEKKFVAYGEKLYTEGLEQGKSLHIYLSGLILIIASALRSIRERRWQQDKST